MVITDDQASSLKYYPPNFMDSHVEFMDENSSQVKCVTNRIIRASSREIFVIDVAFLGSDQSMLKGKYSHL